ncbi:MAG: hypothetical protein EBS53_16360 [Bacteroidetes bacterium]|nr:hypothetical protein [Bacteroidota bacterium]
MATVDRTTGAKTVKRVTVIDNKIQYESYKFLFKTPSRPEGPFRLIYTNSGNCTAWKLDVETGIWGCFADAKDINFDRGTIRVKIAEIQKITLAHQTKTSTNIELFEQTEDAVAYDFFAVMEMHINELFAYESVSYSPSKKKTSSRK